MTFLHVQEIQVLARQHGISIRTNAEGDKLVEFVNACIAKASEEPPKIKGDFAKAS